MTLPGFLIIGAMKAGTTSLYAMLRQVPGLYLPPEKEPGDLLSDKVETPHGLARYAAKFAAAPPGALCGEATTAYAKRPLHRGVAARARRVLGPDLRVIYLVRAPLDRALSQYRHLAALGLERRAPDIALRADPSYADFSRYAWQIAPWQAALGAGQVLVLSLERMAADPRGALERACGLLGVAPVPLAPAHLNPGAGRRVTRAGSLAHRVMRSPAYQYRVKPLMPAPLHAAAKRVLLPRAASGPVTIAPATRALLLDAVGDDPLAQAAARWAQTA